MSTQNLNVDVAKHNAVVLANAAALASAVISNIKGGHVSRTMNNQSLTRDRLEHLVVGKLAARIAA